MKKVLNTPHDRFFRASLSDPRVAHAFFDYHLPPTIKAQVDLNTLQLQKDSFVDDHLKWALTDILFSASFKQQTGYLYTLVEHQTLPEELMAFRFLKYLVAISDNYLKTTQKKQLPIIYPMLFYCGSTPYPYSTDLFDLFPKDHKDLARETYLKPFQLIDIGQIPDENLRQNTWRGIMELCMKHALARDILPFLKDMVKLLQDAEKHGGNQYVQTALTYLLNTGNLQNKETIIETIQTTLVPEFGDKIMTFAEYFREEGEATGLQKGLEKGKIEEKKNIAKNLLKEGAEIAFVAKITKLNIDEIKQLAEATVSV